MCHLEWNGWHYLFGGFTGELSAVHPQHDSVLGVPCVRSALLLPTAPDLAVIVVPAQEVPGVLRVGRGGPAWRRALSGRAVGIRLRDGAVEARVVVVAAVLQELGLLPANPGT